jgi:hypothetical protein
MGIMIMTFLGFTLLPFLSLGSIPIRIWKHYYGDNIYETNRESILINSKYRITFDDIKNSSAIIDNNNYRLLIVNEQVILLPSSLSIVQ